MKRTQGNAGDTTITGLTRTRDLLRGWISSINRGTTVPIYTVTKSDRTQKGKPRVYFDNKHGWADAFYLGNQVPLPDMGAVIEAQTASKTFEDGKTIWFLNSWKTALHASAAPQLPPPVVNPGSWAIDYGDCSRFVSNVLGSAIGGGLIKTPQDIHPWVSASYKALEGLRKGKLVDFDDPIPFGKSNGDPGDDVDF